MDLALHERGRVRMSTGCIDTILLQARHHIKGHSQKANKLMHCLTFRICPTSNTFNGLAFSAEASFSVLKYLSVSSSGYTRKYLFFHEENVDGLCLSLSSVPSILTRTGLSRCSFSNLGLD
mmetsp:Transcript_28810/g.48599  ORF Transcript_28810/g.48599 Transcript_28810/m.48599 type:complete len:121 (+) Transcript_28810:759-1121(+)